MSSLSNTALLGILAGTFVAFGCGESRTPDAIHPDPSYYSVSGVRDTISLSESPPPSLPSAVTILTELAGLTPAIQLGALESPRQEVFGSITATTEVRGDLLVADARYHEIRLFDAADGSFLSSQGSGGPGPSEYRYPNSLAVMGKSDTFLVTDSRSRQIHKLSVGPDTLYHHRSWSTTTVPYGACSLNESLFVHGFRPERGTYIHKYRSPDSLVTSFGKVYTSENPRMQRTMSRGSVVCAEGQPEKVLFALTGLPFIQAYNDKGEPEWAAWLQDMPLFKYYHYPDGDVRNPVPEGGAFALESATCCLGNYAVFQWGLRTPASLDSLPKYKDLVTVAVHVKNGTGHVLGKEVPPLISVNERFIIARRSMPYPMLSVYQRFRETQAQ